MSVAPTKITVIIADDHVLLRKGFVSFIDAHKDIEVIGEAGNGVKLLELLSLLQPDVVVLDITMPQMNGLAAAAIIAGDYPSIGIIMLSVSNDDTYIKQALQLGVKGYLLKDGDENELPAAIRTVYRGGRYYTKEIDERIPELVAARPSSSSTPIHSFTATEIKIITAICKGLTNKQIGDEQHLAKKTIDNYKEKLLHKTGTKNAAELAAYAIINQLVTKEDFS